VVWCSLVLAGCSSNTEIAPPKAPSGNSDARTSAAQSTIDGLTAALQSGDVTKAGQFGLPQARTQLEAAAVNVKTLHLVDLSLRYIADQAETSVGGPGLGPS
jgi:hypothetical protein